MTVKTNKYSILMSSIFFSFCNKNSNNFYNITFKKYKFSLGVFSVTNFIFQIMVKNILFIFISLLELITRSIIICFCLLIYFIKRQNISA